MKKLFIPLFMLITTNGCAASNTFNIDDKSFYLANNSSICQLVNRSNKKKFDSLIPWPCQVHKNLDGVVRIYEDAGKKYILIESSAPHPELPNDCKTQLQSVMINGDAVILSGSFDLVASCPPFQWDTKVFTGLFD
ncbi:MAG: hypothetical protein L3J70_11145 [Gammaproteobacteria bacterium]|nr:hypothetical protein [Gammaproteobacteria bacterium]